MKHRVGAGNRQALSQTSWEEPNLQGEGKPRCHIRPIGFFRRMAGWQETPLSHYCLIVGHRTVCAGRLGTHPTCSVIFLGLHGHQHRLDIWKVLRSCWRLGFQLGVEFRSDSSHLLALMTSNVPGELINSVSKGKLSDP